MAAPSNLPEWDTTEVNSIEATTERKEQGWLAPGGIPEKPPFQTFNWWQNLVFKWTDWFNSKMRITVDSIADLRLLDGSEGSGKASLAGYYAAGDGGGGEFYWDAASTEADNGGTIIKVTAVTTGRWKRNYSGAVNVLWFGAKGDGVTADNIAINACHAFAAANGNGVRYAKKTYIISEEIHFYGNTEYQGNGATIKATSGVTHYMWRAHNIDSTAYAGDSGVNINGFVFDGGGNATGGVAMGHTLDSEIHHNTFQNMTITRHHIDMAGCKGIHIYENTFQAHSAACCQIDQADLGSTGFTTATTPNLNNDDTGCTDIIVRNNRFYDQNVSGVHIHKDGHSDILIDGNVFEACDRAIEDDNNYSAGHSRIVISNNLIDGRNSPGGASSGIVLSAGWIGAIITGNSILSQWSSGVLVDSSVAGRDSYEVSISGNYIRAESGSGIICKRAFRANISNNVVGDYGDNATQRYGVNCVRVSDSSVIGNQINADASTLRTAINVEESPAISVENNDIVRGTTGISISSAEATRNTLKISVTNNKVSDTAGVGIYVSGVGTASKGSSNNISGNIVEAPGSHGIRTDYMVFSSLNGNIIEEVQPTFDNIKLLDCSAFTINNNVIRNVAADSANGIRFSGSGYSVMNGNRISGCTVGILTDTGSDRCIITSNQMFGNTTARVLNGANNAVANNIDA